MTPERHILCHGVGSAAHGSDLRFEIDGRDYAVALRVDQLSRRMVQDLPEVLYDLLEIAAYVYAADAAIPRGGPTDARLGERWRRRMRFEIPVRAPSLWSSDPVRRALEETLRFLSDDDYRFEFRRLGAPPALPGYLNFGASGATQPDEVLLFSGGLDSLAGALEEAHTHQRTLALVSCRSATKLTPIQNGLVEQLVKRVGAGRIVHVPVAIKLRTGANVEGTHRSRSFLYAALAMATARMFGLDRIRFYENGVVSLNLPPANQVVGGRATRSTHPRALAGLATVFSAVFGRPLSVENPFILKTKQDILRVIASCDGAGLIRYAHSCAHVRGRTIMHHHCGLCSQCLDRRIAILAQGLEAYDPSEAYAVDPVFGPREKVTDREMALGYVRNARRFATMTPREFLSGFGEVQRALNHFREPPETALGLLYQLHRRHGQSVKRIIDQLIRRSIDGEAGGAIHRDSLLMLVGQDVFGGRSPELQSAPQSFGQSPVKVGDTIWTLETQGTTATVTIKGVGDIRGVSADLLNVLAENFLACAGAGLENECHHLISARDLADRFEVNEETIRRRVNRARRQFATLIEAAGATAPPEDAIIENIPWRGYRLNPDTTRVLVTDQKAKPGPFNPHRSTRRPRTAPSS